MATATTATTSNAAAIAAAVATTIDAAGAGAATAMTATAAAVTAAVATTQASPPISYAASAAAVPVATPAATPATAPATISAAAPAIDTGLVRLDELSAVRPAVKLSGRRHATADVRRGGPQAHCSWSQPRERPRQQLCMALATLPWQRLCAASVTTGVRCARLVHVHSCAGSARDARAGSACDARADLARWAHLLRPAAGAPREGLRPLPNWEEVLSWGVKARTLGGGMGSVFRPD